MQENRFLSVPTSSNINWPVQSQTQGGSLKFSDLRRREIVHSVYPCSENKGADQLCSYCEAALRLCFHIGKNPIFSCRGLFMSFLFAQ